MNIFGLGGLYGVYGGFGYNSLGTGYLGTGYLSSGYLGSGCSGTGSLIYNSLNNTALKQVNGINSGFAQAASPSFQHVLAASIKGEGLAALLSAQYPDIKYQVMDTSKIDAALWQRNDYPSRDFMRRRRTHRCWTGSRQHKSRP